MSVTKDLKTCFTGAVIRSPEGVPCNVIDTTKLNFGSDEDIESKKTRPVKAWIASGGEKIETAPGHKAPRQLMKAPASKASD